MKDKIYDLIKSEFDSTIESLTNLKIESRIEKNIELINYSNTFKSNLKNYNSPEFNYSDKSKYNIYFSLSNDTIEFLGSKLLGGYSGHDFEDLKDASREIFSCFVGAIKNTLSTTEQNISFSNFKFYGNMILDADYSIVFEYENKIYKIAFDINLKEEKEVNKNYGKLDDVKLNLKVRLGSKLIKIKDLEKLDINSEIEFDTLSNEPFEIVVSDIVIGKGEIVIVDGNHGIQITELFNKED
jgi:flagellar motor switch protein FliN